MGKQNGQVPISPSDEPRLLKIYNFVFEALLSSTRDETKAKLLFLYLRSIVRASNQSFVVLKLGIQPILNQITAVVVNTALFFEHIFTRESEKLSGGIKVWNQIFGPTSPVNPDDVTLIMKYRHILVHDNATRAVNYINKWKQKNNISNNDASKRIEAIAVSTVKSCMRAIVKDYAKYQSYRAKLPK